MNKVSRSSGNVLSSQAAMHKRAVRPRGRRTLTVYRPYLVQHEETDEVCAKYVCLGVRTDVSVNEICSTRSSTSPVIMATADEVLLSVVSACDVCLFLCNDIC